MALVALRFIQGVGVGGCGVARSCCRWNGRARAKTAGSLRRGRNLARRRVSFWPTFAILAFSQLSGDQFLSWGWRVPFWLSLIMVVIGLWIRPRFGP